MHLRVIFCPMSDEMVVDCEGSVYDLQSHAIGLLNICLDPLFLLFPELSRFGIHSVPDVDGASAEGEVVLAAVDVVLVAVGVESHGTRLCSQLKQALQEENRGRRNEECFLSHPRKA
jgi:hypothetical protein